MGPHPYERMNRGVTGNRGAFDMNIFYLDQNPIRAAMQHVDRHVVKMPIEAAQLLSTAHHALDGGDAPKGLYRPAYINHPCGVWVRQSRANYMWTHAHFVALLDEYTYRYKRVHAAARLVGPLSNLPRHIPQGGFSPPSQAMPDEFKDPDPVAAYRRYYRDGKAHLHRWTARPIPAWL